MAKPISITNRSDKKIHTSAASIMTPDITATTMPATTPASRPLLEIPVPVLGVSGTPIN